jgi:glycosyltransferase 2 family protein
MKMFLGIDWKSRLRASAPQMIVGALIGTAALALAFRGVDWRAVGHALLHVDATFTILALLSVAISIFLSVIRWWLLFTPDREGKSWSALAAALLVGQTANMVIPARIGELVRAYLIGTREHVSKTRVLATIVIEKVADLMVFAASIGVLLVVMSLPNWMAQSGLAFVGMTSAIVVVTLALTFWSPQLLELVSRVASRLPRPWHHRVVRFAHAAIGGLRSLRGWRVGSLIWLLSSAILLFSIGTNYLLFHAVGLTLRPVAALFVTVVLRIGQAPPSLPGKIGLFQYLTVIALAAFGVDRTAALTYAFALYAIAVLPVLVVGTVCAVGFRWSAPATAVA